MNLQKLLSSGSVASARAAIHRQDAETVREQLRIVAIPAPTGREGARAAYMVDRFHEIGLEGAHVDGVGNALGELGPRALIAGDPVPPVVVAAHLDTVFAAGTPIAPRHEGARIHAPGITDNARGLAALLRIATVIGEAGIRTARPILFVGTVGEEGLGDLRGAKHLFREGSAARTAAAFVALDGPGSDRIVHRAIGSSRYRATVAGSGGHSWADRGTPNPIHALGAAIARLSALATGVAGDRSVSVGRIEGGTSVNAIPARAWLELDLRSDEPALLAGLDADARRILRDAVDLESRRGGPGRELELSVESIGRRPSGATPPDSPLVKAAVAVTALVGGVPELAASSTDANVPISLGIPAVAIGAGGRGGATHTPDEWFENDRGAFGVERALLLLLAIAGVAGPDQADGAAFTTE